MADSNNTNYMYTVGGYATLIGVGYAIYQVSTRKGRRRAQAQQAKLSVVQPEPRKEDRKKKQRMQSFTSESQNVSTAKATKPRVNAPETSHFLSNVEDKDKSTGTTKDEIDNKEFAKQLSKAKEGTKFTSKNDSGKQKEKSVKQSRANKITNAAEDNTSLHSAPSSATGVDADDDQSPARSPVAGPANVSGVADMLEPVAAAPSILRLTDTESKKQKKKAIKAPEVVETKKQRQNRKKAEAAKAAREDAENERKTLEEKQRRQARIAEGRSAKDGSQFVATKASNSAWKEGAPKTADTQTVEVNGAYQLLDTFEAPKTETVKPAKSSKSEWMSSLPSEEEQLEMLKTETDDSEWNMVTTKSSKKSGKKASSSVESGDDAAPVRPAAQPKQASFAASNNTSKSSKSFGAFSALTSNDEPADGADEEEEEEEWDV